MGLRVVCQVVAEETAISFTWSDGPDSFEPYSLTRRAVIDFRNHAQQARLALRTLVEAYNTRDDAGVARCQFDLATKGHLLYEDIFSPPLSRQVEQWLADARAQDQIESVEIVVDAKTAAARENLQVPWNVVYGVAPKEADFVGEHRDTRALHEFWGHAYNLAMGIRADPLRRKPRLDDPALLFVIDTPTQEGLAPEARTRLTDFITRHKARVAHTRDELAAALADRPQIIYWFSHATPESLYLADDRLSAQDLYDMLHLPRDLSRGGVAFLNACRTAEHVDGDRAYLSAVTDCGMSGIVGTEQETIDSYANEFGLEFLSRFLSGQGPIAAVLREMRHTGPLGIVYATCCPPHITVAPPKAAGDVTATAPATETAAATMMPESVEVSPPIALDAETAAPLRGVLLGGAAIGPVEEETPQSPMTLEPLPPSPYVALASYGRSQRALFAGRRDDCDRFTTILSAASTRLLLLQGMSGVGKTSFLQAEVIPFLEEESIGYQFLRDRKDSSTGAAADSGIVFVRAGKDVVSEIGQAMLNFVARPYQFRRPTGHQVEIDLQAIVRTALKSDDITGLSAAMREDHSLLPRLLKALTDALPFAIVIIVDQAEEIFTHLQGPEATGVLRALAEFTEGDYKIIVSLRTEYFGRMVDALRVSARRYNSVREYLLTDFNQETLTNAITRPTLDSPIAYASDIPREKYGFVYEAELADKIAGDVLAYASRSQDSVLPLIQVICTQLFGSIEKNASDPVRVIREEHLDAIGGVSGGMVLHVDGLIRRLFFDEQDRAAMRQLLSKLFVQQHDGTLTTGLVSESDLKKTWSGRMSYAEAIEIADNPEHRLLKRVCLNDPTGVQKPHLSLGHDSLSRVAQLWQQEEQQRQKAKKRRRNEWLSMAVAVMLIALFMFLWIVTRGLLNDAVDARRIADRAKSVALKQRSLANSHALAARAQVLYDSRPDVAVLLAAEANRREDDDQTRAVLMTVLESDPRLQATLSTIADGVCDTAYSPDGTLLATLACDGHMRVWEVATRRSRDIAKLESRPMRIAILKGNQQIAAAFRDGVVRFWVLASGRTAGQCRFADPPASPEDRLLGPGVARIVTFTPDGTRLAFSERSDRATLWSVPNCHQHSSLQFPSRVRALTFSPDGQMLVAGGDAGVVMAMNIASRRIVKTYTPPKEPLDSSSIVVDVAVSHDNRRIAASHLGGSVSVLRIGDRDESVRHEHSSITAAGFNLTGRLLAIADPWFGSVAVWDFEKSQFTQPLQGHSAAVHSVKQSPDGRLLASASQADDYVALWNLDATCRLCGDVPGDQRAWAATFGPRGEVFYVQRPGDPGSRTAKPNQPQGDLRHVSNGDRVSTTLATGVHASGMLTTNRGRALLVADRTKLQRLDAATGRSIGDEIAIPATRFSRTRIASDESGHVVSYSYEDAGSGNPWRVKLLNNGATMMLPREFLGVIALRVTPDGRLLIVADDSGDVTFWNTATATQAFQAFTGHIDESLRKGAAVSRSGRLFVEGEANRFRLWDLREGRMVGLRFTGHAGSGYMFAFSDDERVLASASDDGTIRLWHVATQQPLGVPLRTGPRRQLDQLQFSPDGQRLLCITQDGQLIVWKLDSQSWREIARRMVTRNLSRQEWEIYIGAEPYRPTFPGLPQPD